VVLPFVDMSPEQDQEYFCHGVTEEIITSLARVPSLRVISRTSAFAFHGRDLEVTEIGRRLRVGAALEGSVRKAGDRVRITTQLVNTEDGYQLWSRRFDRELADVFAIQDEIAATIATELQIGLAMQAPVKPAAPDVVAHDAYLRGMYALNKWNADSMRSAIADFRAAIARDSGFAPAYVALSEANIWLYSGLGVLSADDAIPEARWGVEKALELDPTLADAHRVRALIAIHHDWDRRGGGGSARPCAPARTGSAAAHFWNAWRLALLEKRYDEAFIELEEAERLNPLDLQLKTQIGYVHFFNHNVDRAIEQFEKVLALEPAFAFAHYALGDACTQKEQFEEAIAAFNRAVALAGRSVNHVAVLGYAYGRAGNRDRASRASRGAHRARRSQLRAGNVDGHDPSGAVGSRQRLPLSGSRVRGTRRLVDSDHGSALSSIRCAPTTDSSRFWTNGTWTSGVRHETTEASRQCDRRTPFSGQRFCTPK
jgi:TolB-like protein